MWGLWLMTRFTTSPVLIALMQTTTTLPVFLVGLPAGALADIMNRRRLLLATQGLTLLAAALSLLTYTGLMNATLLLGFTFMLSPSPSRRQRNHALFCPSIGSFLPGGRLTCCR